MQVPQKEFSENMSRELSKFTAVTDSMVFIGVGMAIVYWILESFLYFFVSPEINIFAHLLGTHGFGAWTRLLVLCLFVIFGSHVQYTMKRQETAEIAIGASHKKYQTIIESIDEGYFETDLSGRLTFLNDALCRMAKSPRDTLLGMDNRFFSDAKTAGRMYRLFNQVYRKGEAVQVSDLEFRIPNGEKVFLELSGSLIRNSRGMPTGFRGIVRDVSEKKRAEEEKKRLAIQLQQVQKMEAIGTLASGIAHDFNNLLMSMLETITRIIPHIDSEDPYYIKLKNIEQYIQNGEGLTSQLLGFAKGTTYEKKVANINQLVEKCARMFGRTKTSITIHSNFAQDLWPASVAPGQIEQVLLNLFVNAWHAMPGGGELFIKTENVLLDTHDIKPCRLENGRYMMISVTDTGEGIENEIQERIFEPFFTTRGTSEGTGLGLAMAYGILESHKGGITVYSEIGNGATFNIYLPADEPADR